MKTFRDLFRLWELGRQQVSVRVCEYELARARRDLELAIIARDAALAAVRNDETPPRRPPSFLLVGERGPEITSQPRSAQIVSND